MKQLPKLLVGIGKVAEYLSEQNYRNTYILTSVPIKSVLKDMGFRDNIIVCPDGEPSVKKVSDIKSLIKGDCRKIIGIGGGSVLDIAKCITLEFESAEELDQMLNKITPLAFAGFTMDLIPTTAGTGSEATSIAILENLKGDNKVGIVSDKFIPGTVVLDASLLKGIPDKVFCYSAIDAMIHSVESYLSVNATSLSKEMSLMSLHLILENFNKAKEKDLESLEKVLLGSCFAGYAFNTAGVGAVHALAYPLGVKLHLPHGLANGLLVAEVLKYYFEVNNDEILCIKGILSKYFGEDIWKGLKSFLTQNYISLDNTEINISDWDIESFSEIAINIDRLMKNNIRKMKNIDTVIEIYKKSLLN